MKAYLLVQEFIKEAGGADLRLLRRGRPGRRVDARQGAEGEFRLQPPPRRLGEADQDHARGAEDGGGGVQGARPPVAAWTCSASARGPLVLEVNSSPGLEGIETGDGKDVAGLVIQHIEKALAGKA